MKKLLLEQDVHLKLLDLTWGMGVTYLDPGSSQMGKKESIEDTARVLGRMYDGIEYRGYDQSIVEELARCAGVPVWKWVFTTQVFILHKC